jgi:cystathionine gamma-synthase
MPPIYQTTVYAFENAEQVDAYHAGTPAAMYYRQGSPTHVALEAGIASLEGAEAAVTAASGMGIIMAAVLALAGAGDRIVGDRHAYGGVYTLLTAELPRLGIESVLVDALDPEEVERALEGGAKALLVEALSNWMPRLLPPPCSVL